MSPYCPERCRICTCRLTPGTDYGPRTRQSHAGRGLCRVCYQVEQKMGRLHQWAPTKVAKPKPEPKLRREKSPRSSSYVLEEYRFMRSMGVSEERIAESLGIQLDSLRRAIRRAEAREVTNEQAA